jgi:hypothetical protein
MNSNKVSCGAFILVKFAAFLSGKNDSAIDVYELGLPWLLGHGHKLELCLFVDAPSKEPR